MSPSGKRVVSSLIQIGLVVFGIVLGGRFIARHLHPGSQSIHVQGTAIPTDSLAGGDLRIYSADSSLDIVLKGNQLLTGLSPITVAKVRTDLDTSTAKDTSGIGGSISRIVKQSVAGAIGTHVVYQLADLRDLRYEKGTLIADWKDGSKHDLLGNTKVNGQKASRAFREEDARRLIDAVHARQAAPASAQAPR